jgi:hypothetical protein
MVAVDSRAARSQGLALAGLTIAAAVSGSRRYRNIRIDGRFSAYGMPNARSALHMTFCAQFYAVMTSVSCAMSLRGTGWFGVFGPARPEVAAIGIGCRSASASFFAAVLRTWRRPRFPHGGGVQTA